MKIWLVGMMGSGKSSAGSLAASRLGVEFVDTDEVVANRAGTSIADFWEERGETGFRELEKMVVTELAGKRGIIATGGGVVLDGANRETMRNSGVVIWLDASPPVLFERVGSGFGRPILGAGEEPLTVLRRVLRERQRLYAETADQKIVTDGLDVSATASRIEDIWTS